MIETGETLTQVQDRVLGVNGTSASLFTAIPSYAVFGVRFGMRFGPHMVFVDAENLGDKTIAASVGAWMHRDAGYR